MANHCPDPHVKLTEAEVRKVLKRAAELDGDPRSITYGDLERAAAEAGISSASVVAAANEILQQRSLISEDARLTRLRTPFWVGGVLATLGGAVLGGLGRVLEEFVEPNLLIAVPLTAVLIALSLILAARVRRADDRSVAYGQILGLWVGNMAGWAIVAQEVTFDLVFGLGGLGVATAALAAVVMHFRTAEPKAARAPNRA